VCELVELGDEECMSVEVAVDRDAVVAAGMRMPVVAQDRRPATSDCEVDTVRDEEGFDE
jgi:hypothetical protein